MAPSVALALLLSAFVAACAVPAGNPALEQAEAAVERARSAPRVRALAAAELELAERALNNANAAVHEGAPADQVEHLAYVATQRAALAEARAADQVARAQTRVLKRALGPAAAASADHPQPAPQPSRATPRDPPTPAGPVAGEISVDLVELSFDGDAPTSETLALLESLAQRLQAEPGSSLIIGANFDLPEAASRTAMERRIELVRAALLARDIAPARLVVRAAEPAPTEPSAVPVVVRPSE